MWGAGRRCRRAGKASPGPGTRTQPPIISHSERQMDRPRPVPPYCCVRVASSWLNAKNSSPRFSRGTPMLLAGDEFARTQNGNNNGYAQDSELTWVDWETADQPLIEFTAALAKLRRMIAKLEHENP